MRTVSLSPLKTLWTLLLLLLQASSYATISDETLKQIPGPGTDFDIQTGALLAPILRPRVPGTQGSLEVLQHFLDFFKNSLPEWTVELQNSTSKTPVHGDEEIPFVNLIATRDPPWTTPGEVGRLSLVAHYDSLMQPEGFIGAIDSAAPCAMLMHAARSIDNALTKKWQAMVADGTGTAGNLAEDNGVQILFLDGEEAFAHWSATDSCYGSRSLAETWEDTMNPAMSTFRTPISSISLFLLLDLLGSKSPSIPSYFKTTHWAYQSMAKLESRLRSLQLFKSSPNHPSKQKRESKPDAKAKKNFDHGEESPQKKSNKPRRESLFLPDADKADGAFRPMGIGDDHEPFMARGVDVLHIIPVPFPDVWHKLTDDGEHLDAATVEDWAILISAFTAEWMELEGFMEDSKNAHRNSFLGKRATIISKTEL